MTKLVQRQELGSVLGLNACLFFLDASLSQLIGLPIYAAYGAPPDIPPPKFANYDNMRFLSCFQGSEDSGSFAAS